MRRKRKIAGKCCCLSHTLRCTQPAIEADVRFFGELRHIFCTLALGPLALNPPESPRGRFLQHWHVLREQKESKRQQPESEQRQEAEDAAEHQENGKRQPRVARRRLAQPRHEPCGLWRQLAFEPGKVPVYFRSVTFAHRILLS